MALYGASPLTTVLATSGRLLSLATGVLVGGFGIYVGARAVTGRPYDWHYRSLRPSRTYRHALVTAIAGALAWAALAAIPLVGSLLALVAWVALLRWRYAVDWLDAVGIAVVAWAAAVVVVAALALVGVDAVTAVGVPGT